MEFKTMKRHRHGSCQGNWIKSICFRIILFNKTTAFGLGQLSGGFKELEMLVIHTIPSRNLS